MIYVIFSTQVWTDNWVSKHWIAHWLAELGHDVYFIEPLRALLPRRGGRIRDLFAGPRIRLEDEVHVISFSSLPFYYRIPGFCRALWRLILRRQFHQFSKICPDRSFDLITFDGRSLPLIMMLPKSRMMAYYCVDPVGVGEEKRFSERKLVQSADRVIAISDACKEALSRDTGRSDIDVIPHGIDFKGATGPTFPSAMQPSDLPKNGPKIGYTGSIHDIYVDFEKIHQAATENPDWTFVFVGPYRGSDIARDASKAINPLLGLPNVYFLGSKPYQRLRAYIDYFDVCLIPYRSDLQNDWEKRSPVKMLHYLCLGKPIVCANVPGITAYKDLIYLYDDYSGFIDGIRKSLREKPASALRRARIELATSRDCGLIIRQLIQCLHSSS